MRNFLSSLLATITGLVIMTIVVFLIFLGIISASTSKEVVEVKENSLLLASFNAQILDRANEDPFALLFSGNFMYDEIMGLNQILKDLEKAKTDENIEGIFMKLGTVNAGIATLGEIRDAMQDWLCSEDNSVIDALMQPAADDSLDVVEVSRYVNNASNEGKRCIAPV